MKHAFDGLTYFSTQNISSHLSILGLVAHEAMRLRVDGDVLVPSQRPVALVAAEVLDVPGPVLGARVLGGEDELVAGVAAGDAGLLGVAAGAEHTPVLVVVQKVNQYVLGERICAWYDMNGLDGWTMNCALSNSFSCLFVTVASAKFVRMGL